MFTFPLTLFSGAANIPLGNRSVSFTAASSQYLSMSGANFGAYNTSEFAISLWWKRASAGTAMGIVSQGSLSNDNAFRVRFNAADHLVVSSFKSGNSADGNYQTTAAYADTTSWHHLYIEFDIGNTVFNIYVDGSKINSFSVSSAPTGAVMASAGTVAYSNDMLQSTFFDGLMYQMAFFSGTPFPGIGALYNSGHPLACPSTNLWSLLNENSTDAVTVDKVLATAWTNTNVVVQSSTIPS